jgi:hypothetical protein
VLTKSLVITKVSLGLGMVIEGKICIEYVDGHRVTRFRGLAWFIADPPDKDINAKAIFESLSEDDQRTLRSRFDYWLDGGKHDKYFHGWPNEQVYKDCFVFKLQKLRLFGFLCHPRKDEPRFLLCVLVSHSIKDGWEADKNEKDRMNELKKDPKVKEAHTDVKKSCSKEIKVYGLDRK